MIDGSKYSFEENIVLTKKVVEYAHANWADSVSWLVLKEMSMCLQSSRIPLTRLLNLWNGQVLISLAIAIGTSHGAYKFKGTPRLDFERLEKIFNLSPGFPLALHGVSIVIPEFVEKCNTYGGKIPSAQGHTRRHAAKSRECGRLQNQYRHGFATGHDGIYPRNAGKKSIWF